MVEGEIRLWGSPADRDLIEDWERGFRQFHPQTGVTTRLHGPESTLAGVYTGVADLALMAREMRRGPEHMAFEWARLHKPFLVEVAGAGIGTERPASCLAVVVHRDNPLAQLSLAQLAAVFGGNPALGRPIRTWGELGLTGPWAEKPVRAYGPRADDVAAIYFRTAVLGDSWKWNPELRELESPRQLLAAIEQDPLGIAFTPWRDGFSAIKQLRLAARPEGPFVPLAAATVADRSYPLARTVSLVMDCPPGTSPAPLVREFVRYILSREGQEAVARDGAYTPLTAERANREAGRLP
ncbi:MAG: substrate-binding domain-containing protein [Opitutaceae bacterium]|nr:substrate-binding domain-containing protein [Opitutaceae bacterium]